MSHHHQYTVLARLEGGHTLGVTAISFSPKGSYVATAGLDQLLCVWNVVDYSILHSYAAGSPILSVCWIPEQEDTLVCGMENGSITTLKFSSVSKILLVFAASSPDIPSKFGQEATRFWAHRSGVERLAIKGSYLASGAGEELKVWKRCRKGVKLSTTHVSVTPYLG